MVAYNVKPQFEPKIIAGSKPLTLRKTGKKRHARLGETVQLYTGMRQPGARLIAAPTCILRCRVALGPNGIHRVLDMVATAEGDGLRNLINSAEQGMPQAAEHLELFVTADGFDTYADLYAFHHAEGADEGLAFTVTREVIAWKL